MQTQNTKPAPKYAPKPVAKSLTTPQERAEIIRRARGLCWIDRGSNSVER